MTLREKFSSAIERTGVDALLLKGDESFPFTAGIQPIMTYTGREASPSGIGGSERYRLYAALFGADISGGDVIKAKEKLYLVLRSEVISVGGEALYIKGILRRCESADA